MGDVFVKNRLGDRPASGGEIEVGVVCSAVLISMTIENSGILRRLLSIVASDEMQQVEVLESLLG